ncbi:hypothetical protein G6L37_04640 [Agrobacterium rubi]|nr:hypothetical protein [Agrobacterium rubi]NTF24641.1 hypothetical protein [Agrobacterium rubi]
MVERPRYTVPLEDGHPQCAQPGGIDPHDSVLTTLDVVSKAYDWCIGDDGRLYGLVSGDMGWAATHIVLAPDAIHEDATKPETTE